MDNSQPIGSITAFGGPKEKIPKGWLLCDGTEYDRDDYPTLFAVIGTIWGGNGADGFAVPDLQGIFLRGVSGERNYDPDKDKRNPSRPELAAQGNRGNNVGSKQEDDYKQHVHQWLSGQGFNAGGGGDPYARNDAGYNIRLDTTPSPASPAGQETRPKNAYVYYIIKAQFIKNV